jgi:hypothetical protein
VANAPAQVLELGLGQAARQALELAQLPLLPPRRLVQRGAVLQAGVWRRAPLAARAGGTGTKGAGTPARRLAQPLGSSSLRGL